MRTVAELAPRLGVAPTCAALKVPRASYYRSRAPRRVPKPRPTPARTLSAEERQTVLDVLHEPRFADLAPAQVYATLLEEDRLLPTLTSRWPVASAIWSSHPSMPARPVATVSIRCGCAAGRGSGCHREEAW